MRARLKAKRGTRGSIQIEVLISFSVLVIAVLSFSRTVTGGIQQQRTIQERSLAIAAARQVIEDMRAENFESVYARYNADEADDPAGAGTAPGPSFDVTRLRPVDGDADGMAGRILFPEGPTPTKAIGLREDLAAPEFGLPWDLDGDGDQGSDDVSETYRLLPVVVRVSWRSSLGNQQIELRAWLGGV